MDNFVKKTSYSRRKPDGNIQITPKNMKQATLQSLKRVVVVEEIIRSKAILSTPDQSVDVLLSELAKLRSKLPSIEVLQSTKLGVVLKKLTKHNDSRVARECLNLVNSWKADIRDQRTRKSIDVSYDGKTDRFRKDARRQLQETLKSKGAVMENGDITNLAEDIEREVFAVFGKKANDGYKRTVKKTVFSLRHRADLKQQVLGGKMSLKTLVLANKQK